MDVDARLKNMKEQLSVLIAFKPVQINESLHQSVTNLIGLVSGFVTEFGIPTTSADDVTKITKFVDECICSKGGGQHKVSRLVPRVSKFVNDYLKEVRRYRQHNPIAPVNAAVAVDP